MTATAYFLYLILSRVGFSDGMRLLGVCMFTSSRAAAYSTGAPFVDSFYYFSITTILLLCFAERRYSLFMLFPVLIFSKETMMPFLLLPLLLKDGFRPKYLLPHLLALIVSFSLYFTVRSAISASTDRVRGESTLAAVVMEHVGEVMNNLRSFLSFEGLHDFQHPFSVFLALAVIGFLWTRSRSMPYRIPKFLWALLPIAGSYSLLSSNSGRLLFSAFPLVIIYALVVIDRVMSENDRLEMSDTRIGIPPQGGDKR